MEREYDQLTKFKEDYVHLQKRLKTLPDKTSHEVCEQGWGVSLIVGNECASWLLVSECNGFTLL